MSSADDQTPGEDTHADATSAPSRGLGIYLEATKPHAPSDDTRARLEGARDRLKAVLDNPETSPRDVAAVAREYRIVVERLGALAPPSGRSALDEIAARRRKRSAS